ncbi:hypothetical protein HN748_00715 [Candidatus Peregrinibacteria bacterium]|nr:hypothetical protein [Candidatus Peregrinibacteria bacterium]MBT7484508.1 hypothetical protein [Candidatus Peregrinibacteria bacterium]MBT7702732.1 hypothetical protein [Candidatus Peregrinibacteria bacterium]
MNFFTNPKLTTLNISNWNTS